LTVTPTGGYSGTIAWSCSNLPANASCAFAQNQVALSGNDQVVSVALNITTTQQAENHGPRTPLNPALFALAFWWPGGLAIFMRKRILHNSRSSWQLCLLLVCVCAFAAGLSGCGSSSGMGSGGGTSTPPSTPTPPTTAQVTVTATGTSGTAVSTQTVTLTLTMTQ
jgi:hypothetical protein